jgi:hypothetical protein
MQVDRGTAQGYLYIDSFAQNELRNKSFQYQFQIKYTYKYCVDE